MGLNFTSTKPSFRLVSSLIQTGYVAWPDCFKTFGWLGAVASFSTVHLASPVPVFVAVHPGGGAPTVRLSKLIASARTTATAADIVSVSKMTVFIEASSHVTSHADRDVRRASDYGISHKTYASAIAAQAVADAEMN